MKLSDLDLNGNVFINSDIVFELPIKDQIWSLNEDILSITYPRGYTLDVGWTNEFELNGNFVLHLIKDGDWDSPLFRKEIDIGHLKDEIIKLDSIATNPS